MRLFGLEFLEGVVRRGRDRGGGGDVGAGAETETETHIHHPFGAAGKLPLVARVEEVGACGHLLY